MSDTKYQITKTVRFKLEPYVVTDESQTEEEKELVLQKETARIKEEMLQIRTNSSNKNVSLEDVLNSKNDIDYNELNTLRTDLINIISQVKYLIYKTDTNGNIIYTDKGPLWSDLEIKFSFLRDYIKSEFYNFKNNKYPDTIKDKPPKKYKLYCVDIQFFRDAISGEQGLFERLNEIEKKIEDFTERELHNKSRFADIALVLGDLTKRTNLEFLKAMVNALVVPNNDEKERDLQKNKLFYAIQDLESLVNRQLAYYTPFKSSMGLQTHGGSFNYYTINKDEKELQEEEKNLTNQFNRIIGSAQEIANTKEVEKKLNIELKEVQARLKECGVDAKEEKCQLKDREIQIKNELSDKKNEKILISQIRKFNLTFDVLVSLYVEKRRKKNDDDARIKIIREQVMSEFHLTNKDLEKTVELNIEEMYKFIKLWKGNEKTKYTTNLKIYDDNQSAQDFVNNCKLFSFNDDYDKGGNLCKTDDLFNSLKALECELKTYSDELGEKYNLKAKIEESKESSFDNEEQQLCDAIKILKEKIKKLKKEIGDIFFYKIGLQNYTDFCNSFKYLAVKFGQMKARRAGIEKDKVEAKLLHYWCVIMEHDDKNSKGETITNKYLYLIPKDNVKNAYNDVKSKANSGNQTGNCNLYYFESLTLRALRKLCFKEKNNTFRKELPNWFPKCEQRARKKGETKETPTSEKDRIFYFKTALTSLNNSGVLDIDNNSNILTMPFFKFKTLDNFETELNRCCYKRIAYVNDNYGDELMSKFNAIRFKITSCDIDNSKERCFTTEIWNQFWNDTLNKDKQYPIRLNPEVKIFWRTAKPSRIEKYTNNLNRNQNFKNRYKKDQFTVAFTVTENALTPKPDYGFIVDEKKPILRGFNKQCDLQTNIDNFNVQLNKNHSVHFSIGIDTGTNGLAYATVINVNNQPELFKVLRIKNNKGVESKDDQHNVRTKQYFYVDELNLKYFTNEEMYNRVFDDGKFYETLQKFDNGKVKTEFEKDFQIGKQIRWVSENPSYFLNESLYNMSFNDGRFIETKVEVFEELEVASLDLTTAKVINGDILLDADFNTYQKLKILNAKRWISREARVSTSLSLVKRNNEICMITTNYPNNGKTIYYQDAIHESNEDFSNVFNQLEKHKVDMSIDLVKIEDNINNYRKAIVANMVGVLTEIYSRMQKKYGNRTLGFIAFEGFDAKTIQSHLDKFDGEITVPLRVALMKKLQLKTNENKKKNTIWFENLVPPYAEVNKFSDEMKYVIKDTEDKDDMEKGEVKQFGVIKFVSKANTSECCPICGKKSNTKHTDYFECCEITLRDWASTPNMSDDDKKLFASIDCNDKVAAYNIAKRAIW